MMRSIGIKVGKQSVQAMRKYVHRNCDSLMLPIHSLLEI
jgi:hypothetical protein